MIIAQTVHTPAGPLAIAGVGRRARRGLGFTGDPEALFRTAVAGTAEAGPGRRGGAGGGGEP